MSLFFLVYLLVWDVFFLYEPLLFAPEVPSLTLPAPGAVQAASRRQGDATPPHDGK